MTSPRLPSVARLEAALADCRKKHPRQPENCESLARQLGWATIRATCPHEVETLEACCRPEGPGAAPPSWVPEKCHVQSMLLERCLVEAQEATEDAERSEDRVRERIRRIREKAAQGSGA